MKKGLHRIRERLIREDREQPFLDHLEDFRRMLFRCLIAIIGGTLVCIPLARPVMRWLQMPLVRAAAQRGQDYLLITTSPVEGFVQVVKVVFATGVLISLPLLIWFVAEFVLPGLKPRERRILAVGGFFGAILFAVGVALCYFVSLPVAVNIMFYFNEYLGTTVNWKIERYLAFVLQLMIGFGLAFELPLILILAGRMGLVHVEQLCSHRRHVAVGLLALSMLLTPPDIVTQLQMMIPLYGLYECCIFILRVVERRRKRADDDPSSEEE